MSSQNLTEMSGDLLKFTCTEERGEEKVKDLILFNERRFGDEFLSVSQRWQDQSFEMITCQLHQLPNTLDVALQSFFLKCSAPFLDPAVDDGINAVAILTFLQE